MKPILDRINLEFGNFTISQIKLQQIVIKLLHEILVCYRKELNNLNKKDKNKKLHEIITAHCVNSTRITKTSIRKILKKELSSEEYIKYYVKIMYAILTVGSQLNINHCNLLMENIYGSNQ